MHIRYFSALLNGQLFGLFQSNHDAAVDFQIKQLLKMPGMLVREVDEKEYARLRKQTDRFKAMGNG